MNPLVTIDIEGRKAEMLFTPYLYAIAAEKGIEIKITEADDKFASIRAFVKLMYAAHLNAVSVRKIEGKDAEEFSMMDFEIFSTTNTDAFVTAMNLAVEAMTGKRKESDGRVKKKK